MAYRIDVTGSKGEVDTMTVRYVGIGGNDANSGLSWALRKLTLNGVEDTPVEAGDTVYVGAGTYNERLVCDVSGTSGNPISYIGDYDGTHTDGTGGVVRLTGSADNIAFGTNDNVIYTGLRDYRTFNNFAMDGCDNSLIAIYHNNCIVENCILYSSGGANCIYVENGLTTTINNCLIWNTIRTGIYLNSSSDVNTSHVITNCIFIGSGGYDIRIDNFGDTVIKNCMFLGGGYGVRQVAAQEAAHPTVITNCIFDGVTSALYAVSTADITENYNSISNCTTARTNVDIGAQSNTHIRLPDVRWFFEMLGDGTMISPFDMASYSALVNVAGTTPTTADMRGTTVQGTQREWGALEYDSTLDIEAGAGGGGLLTHPSMTGGMRG